MQIDLEWQKTDQLLPVAEAGEQEGVEGRDYPGHKKTFGMIDLFTVLSVVMSYGCIHVSNFSNYTL